MNKNLNKARSLELPEYRETLMREHSVHKFWQDNKDTLAQAWSEWDKAENLNPLNDSLLDKELKKINESWLTPEKEIYVKKLMKEAVFA